MKAMVGPADNGEQVGIEKLLGKGVRPKNLNPDMMPNPAGRYH